jgi:TetR/AcrR family transcriptional repressor of nem operon
MKGKMRYGPEHKRETKERIIDAALRLIKKNGFRGIGVDSIMKEAQLTVGGFYHHFKSKNDLFNQALERSINEMREMWFVGLENKDASDWLREIASRYLNVSHRDDVENGCPFPALAADISRSSRSARNIVKDGLVELLKIFDRHLPNKNGRESRLDLSLGILATCAGGLLIARAIADRRLSDRVLIGCRRFLESQIKQQTKP